MWPGAGNIRADPLFCRAGYWSHGESAWTLEDDEWTEGDDRIARLSPCAGTGQDGSDMGADLGFCDAIEAFFRRGDTDGTGGLDITDPIFLLAFLFRDSTEPPCRKAADVDDSGSLDITDAVHLLNFLFLSGPPPHVPFPDCGVDPTPDALGCRTGRICR